MVYDNQRCLRTHINSQRHPGKWRVRPYMSLSLGTRLVPYWLMKGYIHSQALTPQKESFNTYLSSARTGVEIAFGRLKSWWRVLLKQSDFHFTFTPYVVGTWCALHNFCEREKDGIKPYLDGGLQVWKGQQQGLRAHMTPDPGGKAVRQALTTYLAANFLLQQFTNLLRPPIHSP